jgi:hypothetical protein
MKALEIKILVPVELLKKSAYSRGTKLGHEPQVVHDRLVI